MMKNSKLFLAMKSYINQISIVKTPAQLALLTCAAVTIPSQASDIEIYKTASANTQATLMLLLDVSGSMAINSVYEDYAFASDFCSGKLSDGRNRKMTENSGRGYTRDYCIIKTSELSNNSNWNIRNFGSQVGGGAWVKRNEDQGGCKYIAAQSEYHCYSRIARLQDALYDTLMGNPAKGVVPLADDKVLGLSTLGVYLDNSKIGIYPFVSSAGYFHRDTGAIRVPARRLDAIVNGKTQRQILVETMATFIAATNTPTARSYAETVAYLMGTTTISPTSSQRELFRRNSGAIYPCVSWNTTGECTSWRTSPVVIDYVPRDPIIKNSYYVYKGWYDDAATKLKPTLYTMNNGSGYDFSSSSTKSADGSHYISPSSLDASVNAECNGQGIYLLSDGAPTPRPGQNMMKLALGNNGSAFSCDETSDDWDCIYKLSDAILDPSKNPKKLKFKTAVVGFGSGYTDIPKYDKNKSKAENLAAITGNSDAAKAARWGVRGEGGWYPGSSSADVVNSINEFIESLNVDIPKSSVGSPTIPVDELNTVALLNKVYFSQFEPTPAQAYQLWAGNLKQYQTVDGAIRDKNSNLITDTRGALLSNTMDFWAKDTADQIGGALANLELGADANNQPKRKVLTNRTVSGADAGVELYQVKLDIVNSKDDARNFLATLLGYNISENILNANTTISVDDLKKSSELRQMGAVMHSSPLLVTNKGTVTVTGNDVTTKDREDYILFGTTQGLLHVVDAVTGKEKFAFVPNEIVRKQKQAFADKSITSGTTAKMFYGVDGAWTNYAEYVPADNSGAISDNTITTGKGYGNQQGKQYVYGGLRMGGRGYYALDLQDVNDPKIKFEIDPDSQKIYSETHKNGKTFKEIGFMAQSWSKPTITHVKWKGESRLVMFVGGGYDAGGPNGDGTFDANGNRTGYQGYENTDYNQTNKAGAGVYMFDANTGELLWWAGANATTSNTSTGVAHAESANMKYSVTSEIRAIDRDSDGFVDHLYFGDLGGQVWRVDINNKADMSVNINNFSKTPVRLLNANDGQYSPRFYKAPAFSVYVSPSGSYFGAISIGSGNESSPLSSPTDTRYKDDAIFNIYDKDVAKSTLYSLADDKLETKDITLSDSVTQNTKLLMPLPANDNQTEIAPYANAGGWYYRFSSTAKQALKVLTTPAVLDSDMYVTVYDKLKPGISGSCGSGVQGESIVNQFCMPYGNCQERFTNTSYTSKFVKDVNAGVGIVAPAIGSSNNTGSSRKLVGSNDNFTGNNSTTYSTTVGLIPQRWYQTSK